MADPLAYLITWTTHGTWLHGDRRGWVKYSQSGIQAPDGVIESATRARLREAPVLLGVNQRHVVEQTVRRHCDIRGWTLHALNVRPHHVHLVVAADVKPEVVMEQLKAWCSRRLNEARPPADCAPTHRKWWTEHGSTKWINDLDYLRNAIRCVLEHQ